MAKCSCGFYKPDCDKLERDMGDLCCQNCVHSIDKKLAEIYKKYAYGKKEELSK